MEMQQSTVFQVLKGAFFALVFSLLYTVIFAVILRFVPLGDKVVYPVNQVVKLVCIVGATLLCVRGEKGFFKGGGIGLIFTALSYLAFAAIGGNFSLSWLIIVEIAAAFLAGGLAGSLAVNTKKEW